MRIEAEEEEDMYRLYNLIAKGDTVEAATVRNVVIETKSGNRDKNRMQMKIAIKVEKIEFDSEQCSLRLNGKNMKENEHIKMGQYHTLEIELHRSLSIEKDNWDPLYLEILDEAIDPTKNADIVAVVMQEGIANLCLVKAAITKNCAKIERTIPKKKAGNQQYEKAIVKFYDDIYRAIQKHIQFDIVKVVLVGSPGFYAEEFLKHLFERAARETDSAWGIAVLKNRGKFVKAHTSCGYKKAIDEMFGTPEILSQLGDVKAADEVRALQHFYDIFSTDSDRAVYGIKDVLTADSHQAIDFLLITDKLYRSDDYALRGQYVQLIDSVKSSGGRVFKFSSMHASGEQLNMYTGVAATLRFPLPDEDFRGAESSDESDQSAEDHEAYASLMMPAVEELPSHT